MDNVSGLIICGVWFSWVFGLSIDLGLLYATCQSGVGSSFSFEDLHRIIKHIIVDIAGKEEATSLPDIIFWMHYTQLDPPPTTLHEGKLDGVIVLNTSSPTFSISDTMITTAREVFEQVTGTYDGFMEKDDTTVDSVDDSNAEEF